MTVTVFQPSNRTQEVRPYYQYYNKKLALWQSLLIEELMISLKLIYLHLCLKI
jgi:hypothetical protein